MSEFVRRTMVSLPPELEAEVFRVRQSRFQNWPQTEMFRYLIRLGLRAAGGTETVRTAGGDRTKTAPGR